MTTMPTYRSNIEDCFRKYYAALCYFASQYTGCEGGGVEDMVQDCFVKMLEKRPVFESELHLRNYLYIAVKNNCINYINKNKIQERHGDSLISHQQDQAGSDNDVFANEVVRLLMEQIDNLPSQCRQIIRMSYVDGLDNQTVAQKLGLSINTVRAQKMRGKSILRGLMGKVAL